MARNGRTGSYTAEELAARRARGEDATDWARVEATTPGEVERDVATDPDLAVPEHWTGTVIPGLPFPLPSENKRQVTVRLDPEVLAYFKAQGRGWQTRINAVLKSFVEHQQHRR
jgi:uncharacterized protein (DUF4415 family)